MAAQSKLLMVELADLAYGDAPYKDIEIASKHIHDVISKYKAGFEPMLSRWPTFPTMLTNAIVGCYGYRFSR